MLSVGLVLGLGLIPDPGAAGARAAQLPPAPILEEDAAATRGWYLRADASLAGLRFRPGSNPTDRRPRSSQPGLEASLGYRLSPILRADVTIGHRFGGTFRAILLDPPTALPSIVPRRSRRRPSPTAISTSPCWRGSRLTLARGSGSRMTGSAPPSACRLPRTACLPPRWFRAAVRGHALPWAP